MLEATNAATAGAPVAAGDPAHDDIAAVPANADFAFSHKIFTLPGARIVMDEARREPAFHVLLGDLQVSLGFDVLRREFGIQPGSRDADLLVMAAKGLRYVREIRPFDLIPRELLDGSASWTVEERHTKIALAKLLAQVGTAISQGSSTNFSVERLMSFNDDLLGREDVKAALAEMAETLGLGADTWEEVGERVKSCAHEFAYIEALREAAGQLQDIDLKLQRLARSYRKDRAVLEELQRIRNLMRKPIAEFGDQFLQIEAQTGEIAALLRNMARQVAFIRAARDDLHHRLMSWTQLLASWRDQPIECGRSAEVNIRTLYQFLARSYAPKLDWR